MDQRELNRLSRAARGGDPQAAGQLVESVRPLVQKLASQLIAKRQLPEQWREDLIQAALLAVWQALPRYRPRRGALTTWIWRPAHWAMHQLLNRQAGPLSRNGRPANPALVPAWRAAARAVQIDDHPELSGADPQLQAVDDREARRADRQLLARGLRALRQQNPELAAAVHHALRGRPLEEIGRRIGRTHEAARGRVNRGRAWLRRWCQFAITNGDQWQRLHG